jgi:hypothetical protein
MLRKAFTFEKCLFEKGLIYTTKISQNFLNFFVIIGQKISRKKILIVISTSLQILHYAFYLGPSFFCRNEPKKHLRGSTQEARKSAFLGYFPIPCVDAIPMYIWHFQTQPTTHDPTYLPTYLPTLTHSSCTQNINEPCSSQIVKEITTTIV